MAADALRRAVIVSGRNRAILLQGNVQVYNVAALSLLRPTARDSTLMTRVVLRVFTVQNVNIFVATVQKTVLVRKLMGFASLDVKLDTKFQIVTQRVLTIHSAKNAKGNVVRVPLEHLVIRFLENVTTVSQVMCCLFAFNSVLSVPTVITAI